MTKFAKTISLMLAIAVMIVALGTLASRPVRAAIAAAAVNIVNTAANPVLSRDVDNQARNSVHAVFIPNGGPGTYVVPTTTSDGRPVNRLVIEDFSVPGCLISSQIQLDPIVSITAIDGGVEARFSFPVIVTGQNAVETGYAVNSQLTKIYADPGSTVLFIKDNAGDCPVINFSGYFVTN